MSDITPCPGVAIEEASLPAYLLTATASAVPAFTFRQSSGNTPAENILWFRSYTDYRHTVASRSLGDVTDSLEYWFANGGGPCYAVCTPDIVRAISQHPDITLVVAAGKSNELTEAIHTLNLKGSPVFFLLDGPEQAIPCDADASQVMADYPATANAAVWYPWARTGKDDTRLPPSTLAAVTIAHTDRQHGVWKSPANLVLSGIEPLFAVTDAIQARFSKGKAMNMLRHFPGKGTTLWGARTLDDSDNWRYIAVRRLCSKVRRDVENLLRPLIFEPNGPLTWHRARSTTENYLRNLWQQGALMGTTAEQAWFVRIGKDITMSEADIRLGKMVLSIGLAAARPAEFITLKFTQSIH